MELEKLHMLKVMYMKEDLKMTKNKVKVCLLGILEKYTMANGMKENNMDLENILT